MTDQLDLPLPFPELARDLPLMPARMVNEYQYCPRLAYLEWVQGEWEDSSDTVEGRYTHRRVDKPGGELPPPKRAGVRRPRPRTLPHAFIQPPRAHREDRPHRGRGAVERAG